MPTATQNKIMLKSRQTEAVFASSAVHGPWAFTSFRSRTQKNIEIILYFVLNYGTTTTNTPDCSLIDGRMSRIRLLYPYMPLWFYLSLLLSPPTGGSIEGDNEGKQNIL